MGAFILLSSQNQEEMVSAILDMNFFVDVALTHFQTTAPDQIIGRLASLTTNFLVTCPEKAFKNLSQLVFTFLDYAHNVSVLNFYENIFSNATKAIKAQILFIENGFAHEIAKRLDEIDISKVADKYDQYFIKYANLYMIVATVCMHQEYVDAFSTQEVINSLSRTFHYAPSYVDGARWEAIVSLVNTKSLPKLEMFIPMAISKLIDAVKEPSQDIVNCINFITKVISLNDNYVKILLQSQVIPIILRIAIQFENSSILLNSFAKFTIECLNHEQSCEKILISYIPLFIATVNHPHYSSFTSLCKLLLLQIDEDSKHNKNLKKKLEQVDCYLEIRETFIKKYKKLIDTHYGGDVYVNIAMSN
ncbi:hypothetical protein TVAG_019780 [Trichomonas vaginalis G3]|uniref:Uncharacterized protein n=1 Tax=Trichomonas vaginalis (strain ATCC PRA-98 / G3) TaxID=412133 RepID=A2DX50_TRIV3|nr:hypothetical protein TVAGG3_0185960 [Trichomonas vaginalis G3]EAY15077.1 hypothetical protein TVAG_019780 [Trichomonas vaginalis G3]KAI5549643.1 hypothetical protein TVAGG3_0185960 [Trichomonas vaginalis G3]|eukprot:XP_001327300.1 hypothetical protein [Trichomonas vaginalis G3]